MFLPLDQLSSQHHKSEGIGQILEELNLFPLECCLLKNASTTLDIYVVDKEFQQFGTFSVKLEDD